MSKLKAHLVIAYRRLKDLDRRRDCDSENTPQKWRDRITQGYINPKFSFSRGIDVMTATEYARNKVVRIRGAYKRKAWNIA